MSIFKKIFSDKAQVSGINMMLRGLGIDIESLLPQAEKSLKDWFSGMEAKAGSKLTAVAVLDNDKFIISLYKVNEDGSLSAYGNSFELSNFKQFLNNLENIKNVTNETENRPVAEIASPTDEPTADPGADTDPGADSDPGSATEPAEPAGE